jgi:hypothetical protein
LTNMEQKFCCCRLWMVTLGKLHCK